MTDKIQEGIEKLKIQYADDEEALNEILKMIEITVTDDSKEEKLKEEK